MLKRDSNFELLRIFSMLLIIAHHYSVHGGWIFNDGLQYNKAYIQFLYVGGKIGVNLFVLITGYFSFKNPISLNKIICIISKAWFYSIFFFLLFYYLDIVPINQQITILSLLPLEYWFISTFVCLLALIPFLNKMIINLNKIEHLKLILIFSILACTPIMNGNIGHLGLFFNLYFIGSFFKKFYADAIFSRNILVFIICINMIIIVSSILLFDYYQINKPLYFSSMKSPFTLCLSISIFIAFKQINIGRIKFINIISSTMLGVYLIHDNSFVRHFLWDILFQNSSHFNKNDLYIHSLLSIALVFMFCMLIDLIRGKIVFYFRIDKFYYSLVDRNSIIKLIRLTWSNKFKHSS